MKDNQPNRHTDMVSPANITTEEMAYSNKVYLSPHGRIPAYKKFITLKGYVLSCDFSEQIPKGKIGLSKKFREFLVLSLIDQVVIQAYDGKPTDKSATAITIKVEYLLPPRDRVEIDDSQLVNQLQVEYRGYYIAVDQIFVTRFMREPIIITIDRILGNQERVFLSTETKIDCFASADQHIRLKSTKNVKKNIFSTNFSMESLGIGGLDAQLTNLFRRAFASRRLPQSIMEKFGIKHVKGILLYGPPGTGKTLIARQLAHTLKAKSIQVVNGPEVFSKFIGESEENVRKLFEPARKDQKKFGDQSPIHVVVFDEIDAICRQRGGDGSSSGSKDAVVNQLLTNLDGVEALNNIIVIGMTNRKDLIDEAILRPGRLEVQIEVSLPDEQGRVQIFTIHTKKLKEQKLLGPKVNLEELAKVAKNFTGAEIEAVVKNASSYAMTKGNDIMDFSRELQIKAGTLVERNDFIRAISETIPGFGIDQQNFEVYMRSPLIDYGSKFAFIMKMLSRLSTLTLSSHKQVNSVLLMGEPGTGKTSLACHFAKNSPFSYVKIIAPERYIGVDTYGRINSMNKIFTDAYKAKESLIILDNIERLVEYVRTGPDYNNTIMQALLTLLKRIPSNPDCRLLVIGTTSNFEAMDLLDIDKAFKAKINTPLLDREECAKVLGAELGAQQLPIKKLVNFKQIIRDKPQPMWKSLWQKFS